MELEFAHSERDSGGSKWPVQHEITAHEGGDYRGHVRYLTSKTRRKVLVDNLTVDPDHRRQGVGSSLMDELQRRHPNASIDHGDRTDAGKQWWSGYTRDKDVRRGRTAAEDHSLAGEQTENERNHARYGCYHVACGRVLSGRRTALLDDPAMDRPARGIEPVRHVIEGARAYASQRGLGDPHGGEVDYGKVRTHRDLLRNLGHAYDKLPQDDPSAHKHFAAMRDEVNDQYHHLTHRMGIKVHVTDEDPYPDVHALRHDVEHNRRIQVLGTHATGGHPFFSNDENDKFRAVHDVFGHLGTGRDFDRHGEEASYQAHARMFTPAAHGALASETRSQNAHLIVHGHFAPQKIAIMPKHLWSPSLAHFGVLGSEPWPDLPDHWQNGSGDWSTYVDPTSVGPGLEARIGGATGTSKLQSTPPNPVARESIRVRIESPGHSTGRSVSPVVPTAAQSSALASPRSTTDVPTRPVATPITSSSSHPSTTTGARSVRPHTASAGTPTPSTSSGSSTPLTATRTGNAVSAVRTTGGEHESGRRHFGAEAAISGNPPFPLPTENGNFRKPGQRWVAPEDRPVEHTASGLTSFEVEEHLPAAGKRPALRMHLKHRVDPVDGYTSGNVAAYDGDIHVGDMPYGHNYDDSEIGIGDMEVVRSHRRRGVASAMLDFARGKGIPVQHNIVGMTPAGYKFMDAYENRHEAVQHTAAYFHGSDRHIPVGQYVEPGHQGTYDVSRPDRVYLTDNHADAAKWASDALEMRPSDHPYAYVHEVEPEGPVTRHEHEDGTEYHAPRAKVVRVTRVKSPWHEASQHKTAASGLEDGSKFAERLDKGPDEEPYLSGRAHEYSTEHVAPGGQQYRLMHDYGGFSKSHVTAHQRMSNGKYRGVGYLSWFPGKPRHNGSSIDGGVIHKVQVSPQHQRRGLASAMLAFARERNPDLDIRHSTALTDEGRAWAEKVGGLDHEDNDYLRFGDWPKDERSRNHAEGWHEEGVSTYDLHHGRPVVPGDEIGYGEHGNDTHDELQGRIRGFRRGGHPAYVIKGEMVGVGHDGEPLLRGIHSVRPWEPEPHHLTPAWRQQIDKDDPHGHGYGKTAAAGHASLFHITDRPDFKLDPHHTPDDNTMAIQQRAKPGLFAAGDKHGVEHWVNGQGYVRPYVAEVHVPAQHVQSGRWGGEKFLPAEHFDKAKVHRVVPLDAIAREQYGDHGWIEDHHGTEFDTGKPIPRPGSAGWSPSHFGNEYHYDGPDARDMSPEQHAHHKQRALDYLRENRGHDEEDVKDLARRWASLRQQWVAPEDVEQVSSQTAGLGSARFGGSRRGMAGISHIGMGASGPDYSDLEFDHLTGKEYGTVPAEHHHEVLFAKRRGQYGYVGNIHYEQHPDHIQVHNMEVRPEHQRRGVASQLMGELERRHPGTTIDHGVRSPAGTGWGKDYYGHEGPRTVWDKTVGPDPDGWTDAPKTRDRQKVEASRYTAAEDWQSTHKGLRYQIRPDNADPFTDKPVWKLHVHPEDQKDGHAVGGYVQMHSDDDHRDESGEWDPTDRVKMVEVNPTYRRRGVGTALIQHVQEHARAGYRSFDPGQFTPDGAHLYKSMTGETVRPSTRSDRPDRPVSEWHTAKLSDEALVSVAEHTMEQNGHAGRTWHVPKMHADDPKRQEAHQPVHDFVRGVLTQHGYGDARGINVIPSHWDLREPGSGQAMVNAIGSIGLKGEHTNDLTLLHECAHLLTRTPEGPGGHGPKFQEAAHRLYHDHISPEAADTFNGIVHALPREGARREDKSQFPMTVYRGEGSHDRPSHYPKGSVETGAWWTSDPDSAQRYARGEKGSVYQLEVDHHEAEPRGLPGYYFIKDPAVRARRSLVADHGERDQHEGARHASAETWYHGTKAPLVAGDRIVPAAERGVESHFGDNESGHHVHVTNDPEEAWFYAHRVADPMGKKPRVYRVQPQALRPDPYDDYGTGRRTDHAVVLDEVDHPADCLQHEASHHTASAGGLPPGYSLRTREEEKTQRWGLPALHVDVRHGGQQVGSLSVHQRQDATTGGALVGHPNIYVDPDHQRKGLGTALYAEVHRRWPDVPVVHSPHASDDARALNESLKDRFPDRHHGSRQSENLEEYRLNRHVQDRRAEEYSKGHQSETDEFYGRGGHGGQEKSLTLKDWMRQTKQPTLEDQPPEFQEHWRGYELGHAHGLTGGVDAEELDRQHDRSSHPDHFLQGYGDGLGHAMDTQDRVAVLVTGKSTAPAFVSLMKVAHVSGNTVDALHCPFCGSGSVTARSDGSIECGFCTAAYTVQVQPQFSAFPQSVDGAQYPWPGRDDMGMGPGGGPVPPGVGGAPVPGEDPDEEEGGGPPWAQGGAQGDEDPDEDEEEDDEDPEASVGGAKAPPFVRKSYRTSFGGEVLFDDYLDHLILTTAADQRRTAAVIKAERPRKTG
jgi:GNAT superfamily N-acetyltransferase